MEKQQMMAPPQARRCWRHNTIFFWLLSLQLALQLASLGLGFFGLASLVPLLVLIGSVLAVVVLIDAIVLHVQNHRVGLPTQGFWVLYLSRVISVVPTLIGGGQAFANQVAAVAIMVLIIAEVLGYFTWRTTEERLRPLLAR